MLFSRARNTDTNGTLLIDIGSGSIGMALVLVEQTPERPTEVLWSHREYALLRKSTVGKNTLKDIDTALFNAFLEFTTAGQQKAAEKGIEISNVAITVSAPWAHTSTRNALYEKETAFAVDDELIETLTKSAKSVDTETSSKLEDIGLSVISTSLIEVRLNDYVTKTPSGKVASQVMLTLITSAIAEKLRATVTELCEKSIPTANIQIYSFIDILYRTLRHHKPYTSEACIIDITDEATELGIIRDDILRHAVVATSGIQTLVRTISEELKIPTGEAVALLRLSSTELKEQYSEKQIVALVHICEAYKGALTELLETTGDDLRLPPTVFLHTDAETNAFFAELIHDLRKTEGSTAHHVLIASAELFGGVIPDDSALSALLYFMQHKLGTDVVQTPV